MTTTHTSGAADLPEVFDAIADSQYLAGVTAGWNAAQANDPNAALRKIHESRAGYLKPLRDAKVAALAAGQAVAPAPLRGDAREADFSKELADTAMSFVDRAGDVVPGDDDAETICAQFHEAMAAVVEKYRPMPKPSRAARPAPPARHWPMEEQPDGTVNPVDPADMGICPAPPAMDGGDAGRLERERICAAIKAEDDYCVDHGNYMLDSDDCIKIVRGEWVRPEFAIDAARAAQKEGA